MTSVVVKSSKGQFKIQEMAFVLVALMILFALIAVIYVSLRVSSLRQGVEGQQDEQALLLARKLATTPELAWLATTCAHCIDTDKALMLKQHRNYNSFWDVDYLAIEWVVPALEGECTPQTYPSCKTITIINRSRGTPVSSFVALCRHEEGAQGTMHCTLGKILVSGRSLSSK